ncbi:MAG: AMP-binding protein [Candidatus Dormibacteraeota bacterium]|nr:AMP-binding protein [Candidatus Dormibacteraeota bacterium]
MPDVLALQAAAQPEKPALIEGGRVVSYALLNERANRAAYAFHDLGITRGERVATMAFNSTAGFEVTAGLRKVEGVGVPVNFRLRGEELAYVLNDSGARVVCAGPDFVEHVHAVRKRLSGKPALVALGADVPPGWLAYEDLLQRASAENPAASESEAMGASMIYTSGTTGRPKGAFRPNGVAPEFVLQSVQLFGLQSDDVHLMAGPGYHSAVGFFCALTLATGATIVIMPRFDAEEALRLIDRHRVTTTFMAPTLLGRMMDLPQEVRDRYDVSSMRALILGAAPCPFALKERAVPYFGECIYEFYGATETGVNLILRPEEQLKKPGSVGRVSPGQEIRLLDDQGNPVPEGQPGELWVRNGWLASYHGRPDATERSMRDGFFSVGDVAYRDGDGFYYLCDRKIDMVISGGVNIYPAEVEACLFAHPAVRDVAVIGVPDDQWGESVKAIVALQPGAAATEAELIDWCRGRIADYKRPRSVDFVENLPRDQAGKLLKRQIREPYWAGTGRRI